MIVEVENWTPMQGSLSKTDVTRYPLHSYQSYFDMLNNIDGLF